MRVYILSFLALSIFLTSCTTKLNLSYNSAIKTYDKNNTEVIVNSFYDNRSNIHEVGSKRNSLGMPIIKIITDDNVSEWVTNALKAEMGNAGYSIVDNSQDSVYEVSGKLLKAYTTTYLIYHGRMSIRISVKKDDREIFDKTYHTKESGGMNWLARNVTCAKTLELNLQKICRQFINDLNDSIFQTAINDEKP